MLIFDGIKRKRFFESEFNTTPYYDKARNRRTGSPKGIKITCTFSGKMQVEMILRRYSAGDCGADFAMSSRISFLT